MSNREQKESEEKVIMLKWMRELHSNEKRDGKL